VDEEFGNFNKNYLSRFVINRYGGKIWPGLWRSLAPLRGAARKNLQYSLMFAQDGSII
jgi:hypothetical protein